MSRPASGQAKEAQCGFTTGNATLGRAEDLAWPHLAAWIRDTAKSCHSEASSQEEKASLQGQGGPESSSVPLGSTLLPYSVLYFSAIRTSGQEPCRLSFPWASFLPRGDEMFQREIGSPFSLLCYVVKKKKSNKNTHHAAPISS